ncbi:MAG: hypothetical protein HY801_02620 [Candidatus Lindowbacteria bacterium]|nr:hypothetical protein [Candidatus Lindowbacteria bacterium]
MEDFCRTTRFGNGFKISKGDDSRSILVTDNPNATESKAKKPGQHTNACQLTFSSTRC